MVECEFVQSYANLRLSLVLIDTWWNVNLDEIMLRLAHDTVLIDTWWNVNAVACHSVFATSAF